jgi:hypothetical protein
MRAQMPTCVGWARCWCSIGCCGPRRLDQCGAAHVQLALPDAGAVCACRLPGDVEYRIKLASHAVCSAALVRRVKALQMSTAEDIPSTCARALECLGECCCEVSTWRLTSAWHASRAPALPASRAQECPLLALADPRRGGAAPTPHCAGPRAVIRPRYRPAPPCLWGTSRHGSSRARLCADGGHVPNTRCARHVRHTPTRRPAYDAPAVCLHRGPCIPNRPTGTT